MLTRVHVRFFTRARRALAQHVEARPGRAEDQSESGGRPDKHPARHSSTHHPGRGHLCHSDTPTQPHSAPVQLAEPDDTRSALQHEGRVLLSAQAASSCRPLHRLSPGPGQDDVRPTALSAHIRGNGSYTRSAVKSRFSTHTLSLSVLGIV